VSAAHGLVLWLVSSCTPYQPGPPGSEELLLSGSTLLLALKITYKAADAGCGFVDYWLEIGNMNPI